MQKTLTIGPLPIIFSNENPDLHIPFHHHYAEVKLGYRFSGNASFPVLASTMDEVKEKLESLVEQPLMNQRNEDLLDIIYNGFKNWKCEKALQYQGEWSLFSVELSVLGIRDKLGHADGIATYRLEI